MLCSYQPEGFFLGLLKISLGVFIGALAAMFAYEYILGLRLSGRISTVFDSSPTDKRHLKRLLKPIPPSNVGEIEWADDPDSKRIIRH